MIYKLLIVLYPYNLIRKGLKGFYYCLQDLSEVVYLGLCLFPMLALLCPTFVGAVNLDSGSHACIVVTLLAEPSLQFSLSPMYTWVVLYFSISQLNILGFSV